LPAANSRYIGVDCSLYLLDSSSTRSNLRLISRRVEKMFAFTDS